MLPSIDSKMIKLSHLKILAFFGRGEERADFQGSPRSTEDLLMTLCLGMTPGGHRRPYELPGLKPRSTTCKESTISPTIKTIKISFFQGQGMVAISSNAQGLVLVFAQGSTCSDSQKSRWGAGESNLMISHLQGKNALISILPFWLQPLFSLLLKKVVYA